MDGELPDQGNHALERLRGYDAPDGDYAGFTTALKAYLDAAKAGALDADIVGSLIMQVDALPHAASPDSPPPANTNDDHADTGATVISLREQLERQRQKLRDAG